MRALRTLAAAASTIVVLLAAGCGGDGSGGGSDGSGEPKAGASHSPSSEAPTSPATESSSPSTSPSDPEDTALTDSATPSPSRVEEISGILDCDLEDGKKSPEGATEYPCGDFLIVDWGTAGVTEQEMWDNVDSWVDEQRPSYIPADQFIIVYGTHDALAPHSKELLGH